MFAIHDLSRLTEMSGVLIDGAGEYETDTMCTWLIDSNSTSPLKLSFNEFSTECGWDHLYVFDGTSIYSPLVAAYR